jgi:hypothetical protein
MLNHVKPPLSPAVFFHQHLEIFRTCRSCAPDASGSPWSFGAVAEIPAASWMNCLMKQVKMVPQNPFDFRIFHYKPSSYWGSSIYGHPQMRKENWGWQMP